MGVTIGRPGQFQEFERHCRARMEAAALRASDRAAREALKGVRGAMRAAGLGKIANAIGAGSDEKKSGTARQRGNGFSASGWLHVRGRSRRTLGAIESYTKGAQIGPRRGRWLAVPTKNVPRRAGRYKMTPALYEETGLDERIGPLDFVPGKSSNRAYLVIRGPLSVDRFGRTGPGRHARRLPKRGRLGGTRKVAQFKIAFVLIRATSRSARFDPETIIASAAARMPALLTDELKKEI